MADPPDLSTWSLQVDALDGHHQTHLIHGPTPAVIASDALVLVLFVDSGRKNACAKLLQVERFRRECVPENENDDRDGHEGEMGWYEKGACPQTVCHNGPHTRGLGTINWARTSCPWYGERDKQPLTRRW